MARSSRMDVCAALRCAYETDQSGCPVFRLNSNLMHHRPHRPTTIYTLRAPKVAGPPKIQATKSKEIVPTRSQLTAPMMTSKSASVSKGIPSFHD